MAEKISSALVGREFPALDVQWNERDVLIYALGIGAKPSKELDFLYEGRGPKVMPTYLVTHNLTSMMKVTSHVEFPLAMVLHGEQSFELHREIPASVKNGKSVNRVVEVWDKGKAAVLGVETTISDDDGPIYTGVCTWFIRGAGGFGGERGPSSEETRIDVPDREPDFVVNDKTTEEQAALYRLSGDRNPIHIDPDFAKYAGFPTAFLHGLCTYGFAGRAALATVCGGDVSKFKGMKARFADVVYCGDELITKVWVTKPGVALLQVETQKGNIVLNNAEVTFAV